MTYKRKKTASKKKKTENKPNFFIRLYRFSIPKDFHAELVKGQMIGENIRRGRVSPKVIPTWWLGKVLRMIIDPNRKMKVGKDE